ncbi:MAG: hypothetical protein ACOX4M_08735 [Acetivibrionales bacterium]
MMLVDERGRLVTEDMFIALIALVLFRKMKGMHRNSAACRQARLWKNLRKSTMEE